MIKFEYEEYKESDRIILAYGHNSCFVANRIKEILREKEIEIDCYQEETPSEKSLPDEVMDKAIFYVLADGDDMNPHTLLQLDQLKNAKKNTSALIIGMILGNITKENRMAFEEHVMTIHLLQADSGDVDVPAVVMDIDNAIMHSDFGNLDAETLRDFFKEGIVTAKEYSAKGEKAAEAIREMLEEDPDWARKDNRYILIARGALDLFAVTGFLEAAGEGEENADIECSCVYEENEENEIRVIILQAMPKIPESAN